MYTNLKTKALMLLVILSLFSCGLFEDDGDAVLTEFSITPKNYYGKKLTGLVKFENNVETPVWYSASGMLKFDGVSTSDSVTSDSVLIYYTAVPYISKVFTDTAGNDSIAKVIRTTDTISIRYYDNNKEYVSTKEIDLKNFKPTIDSLVVSNGNYMEFGSRRVASFLIGSGTGKIKCFTDNFNDDSVSIYWHSNSANIAERRLMNYLPFEFEIPVEEDNVMLYMDVINKNGAVREDSVEVTMYKERGSVWVMDESETLFKFSSLGGAIARIESVSTKDIVFLEGSNSLIVQGPDSISRYYTTGGKLGFAFEGDNSLTTKFYNFDNNLYSSASAMATTSYVSTLSKLTDEGELLEEKVSYIGQITNFLKHKDHYVVSESRNDSVLVHIIVADSVPLSVPGFLRVTQMEKYPTRNYVVVLDDIVSQVTVINLSDYSVLGKITGFKGKPVAMAVNEISGALYIIDASSNLIEVNLNTMSGNLDVSASTASLLGFDLPRFVDINEYADSDGAGNVWVCDTHNDRVVKLNSSGSLLVEINGYFHLPQKLVINKGL